MRIITLNANGIRAASRKGFFDWLPAQKADFVCIQETKAQINDLKTADFFPVAHHSFYHDAVKRGYSGTAIYSRHQPDRVQYGLGWDKFDSEGRWLQTDFGNLSVVSLYLPSGSSSDERQQIKFEVMDWLMPQLKKMARSKRQYVICGDWNIAHKEIDLKNWRGNKKNSGFLPAERGWLDELFGKGGMVDAFRQVEPGEEQYTWWSNRGQAYAKNVGWRIDYQIATKGVAKTVQSASIFKDERFSDHAPLIMDYDWEIAS